VTLQVGDKVVAIPLRDGGRVAVRSGDISVGDKAVLIPGANGQVYAVRPASPQVGDRVIVYPLRNGGHVCLASADDDGWSSPSVMPPGNFDVRRTGPGTADLEWLPGEGNTAVRIVRRPDRYPVHINDGTTVYEGAGREATDSGLDWQLPYYYCAWGKAGSKYSNGYLMDWVGAWGSQSDPVHLCDPWRETMPGRLYRVCRGPFVYYWDGAGSVYATGSPDNSSGFRCVGGAGLNIYGPKGWAQPNLWSTGGTIKLNGVLNPGRNEIYYCIINFETVYTGMATPLWIMRAL
jgi:hypothetical protein